jgi:hypothetical protein
MTDFGNLSTRSIPTPGALSDAYGLAGKLPVATPRVPQLELVLENFGSRLLTPLLFNPGQYPKQPEGSFDDHTAFPERDNVQLYQGKQVIALVNLSFDSYEVEQYNPKTQQYEKATITGRGIDLGTVLLEVGMSKNIVTTSLNGRNGTVKEYIADGDFAIKIQGALVNPTGTAYPIDQVKLLMAILKAPVALKVTSDFLGLFPVYNLVIENYNLPQREGFTNTQFFELQCLSDNPVELVKL